MCVFMSASLGNANATVSAHLICFLFTCGSVSWHKTCYLSTFRFNIKNERYSVDDRVVYFAYSFAVNSMPSAVMRKHVNLLRQTREMCPEQCGSYRKKRSWKKYSHFARRSLSRNETNIRMINIDFSPHCFLDSKILSFCWAKNVIAVTEKQLRIRKKVQRVAKCCWQIYSTRKSPAHRECITFTMLWQLHFRHLIIPHFF